MLEPWFLTEGLATYIESRYTSAGRGRDPRWEMMLRMDVLENNLKSIDQAAVDTVKWPLGNLRYLYGVEFLQYLAEKYGEKSLVSLIHLYGDYLFSSGIDGAFTAIYQKSLSALWNEWVEQLSSKFKSQKSKLGELTNPKLITTTGYFNLKPKWEKDSQSILYLQRNADDYPQLRRIDLISGKNEKVLEGLIYDDSLSLSPDGRTLLFSKAGTYKNYYLFKDLYSIDLDTRKVKKLTEGLRASDPSFSPDGKAIIYVKNEKGTKVLRWLGREQFTSPEVDVQNYSPVFSPDGEKICVSKHTPDGRQKLYLIDVHSGKKELLIQADPASTEANPSFSPDGKLILFDSDRSGIVNLYAYQLKEKKLYRLTNVLGGAMMPEVSPDSRKIAYVSYSSRGYDIAMDDFDPAKWREISLEGGKEINTDQKTGNQILPVVVSSYEIHSYNPFPSLRPLFWLPYNYYNENGSQTSIYLGGLDPLVQHMYYLNFGYDFEGSRPFYAFTYLNNNFLPQITVNLSDLSVPYDLGGTSVYWERERQRELSFSFVNNRLFCEYDAQQFTFGVQNLNLSNISSLDSFPVKPSLGNLNALLFAWRYRNDHTYPFSISPEDGLDLRIGTSSFLPQINSDFSFTNFNAALKNYFKSPLGSHQVFAPSLNAFYSRGVQLAQGNFTSRFVTVRGYSPTAFKGSKGLLLSLEYRFPLIYLEKGLYYGSTFFDRVWGNFFLDLGGVDSVKKGIGAELNLDTSSLWGFYAFTFKLGYAKGVDAGGEEKFYFTLRLPTIVGL